VHKKLTDCVQIKMLKKIRPTPCRLSAELRAELKAEFQEFLKAEKSADASDEAENRRRPLIMEFPETPPKTDKLKTIIVDMMAALNFLFFLIFVRQFVIKVFLRIACQNKVGV
jgi:hypothetical protein